VIHQSRKCKVWRYDERHRGTSSGIDICNERNVRDGIDIRDERDVRDVGDMSLYRKYTVLEYLLIHAKKTWKNA
jgi:hypothetical protein